VRLAAVLWSHRSTWPGWRCTNELWSIAAAQELPEHWRLVLKPVYAHLQRKEVRIIKPKEGTGLKRVNINVEVKLHNAFKATTAAQGTDMTTVLMECIQNYVAKHGYTTPQKNGRRA
jgi:hypothetical protein